jgi:hypothetical protein
MCKELFCGLNVDTVPEFRVYMDEPRNTVTIVGSGFIFEHGTSWLQRESRIHFIAVLILGLL